jgi:two-component system, NtrC family, sensor kinase
MEPSTKDRHNAALPLRPGARLFLSVRWSIFAVVAILALGGGGIAMFFGYDLTSEAVIGEAQRRAELDLVSAWASYRHELDRVALVVKLVSQTQKAHDLLAGSNIDRDWARMRIEDLRRQHGLDVLTLVGTDGRVVMRSRFPYRNGDPVFVDSVTQRALRGLSSHGTVLVPSDALDAEGQYLRDQVFIEVRATPMAAPSFKTVETDGMMLKAAEPVHDPSGHVIGFVYGGVLLNRNYAITDGIRDTIFKGEQYKHQPLGTVTIFQGDLRIATNVLNANGTRAIGTRVSNAVREQTIENGRPYYDRAFVVKDWFLTAYDPIRDPDDKVIGILYVGILEQKFVDYKTNLTRKFELLMGAGVLVALVAALVFAVWLSAPIKRLTAVAAEMTAGNLKARVREGHDMFKEISHLNWTFNHMADTVIHRSDALAHANARLEKSNAELTQLNQNYMDMLGFVTHELKSPLASTMFSLSAIKQGYFGNISPEQTKVIESVEKNVEYLNEMILNYLNLSRIERGELQFTPESFLFKSEVLDPVFDQVRRQLDAHSMTVESDVPADLTLEGDPNLLKIVMDNLLSNACKYGKRGTVVHIRHRPARAGANRFYVRNEGRGISEEDRNKLFKKFSRLAVSELRAKKGTGLGLFITHAIVQQHGGKIWVDSKEGEWTEFCFEIPAVVPRHDALHLDAPADATPLSQSSPPASMLLVTRGMEATPTPTPPPPPDGPKPSDSGS